MLSQLSIHALIESQALVDSFLRSLDHDRYRLTYHLDLKNFVEAIASEQPPDCLVVQASPRLPTTFHELVQRGTLLPTVILTETIGTAAHPARSSPSPQAPSAQTPTQGDNAADPGSSPVPRESHPKDSEPRDNSPRDNRPRGDDPPGAALISSEPLYHPAEVWQQQDSQYTINQAIDRAIVQFLQLSPLTRLSGLSATLPPAEHYSSSRQLLVQQQQRLSEKLKERLGYLGVYYKRDPKQFLRHLPPAEAQELWDALRKLYRDIVLNYFEASNQLNSLIDEFVNLAFFADIPVTNIVELHMELMDEFSKQLKMEGRSEEILLDYRLTLIDAIAHLCEMYRRSIPRD